MTRQRYSDALVEEIVKKTKKRRARGKERGGVRRRMKFEPFTVNVAYDSRWHGWGVPDERIREIARVDYRSFYGSGTNLITGYRDLSFGLPTRRAANAAVKRLRKAFRGYRLRVRMYEPEPDRPSRAEV